MSLPSIERLHAANATLNDLSAPTGRQPLKIPPTVANRLFAETLNLVARAGCASNVPDGFPQSTAGSEVHGSTPGSSVESTVLALIHETADDDPVYALAESACGDLLEAVASLRNWESKIKLAVEMKTPKRPATHSEEICAEPSCEDPSVPGGKGRCDSCRKWRERWVSNHPGDPSTPPVPETLHEARKESRAQLARVRVHVTGPYAEEGAS